MRGMSRVDFQRRGRQEKRRACQNLCSSAVGVVRDETSRCCNHDHHEATLEYRNYFYHNHHARVGHTQREREGVGGM